MGGGAGIFGKLNSAQGGYIFCTLYRRIMHISCKALVTKDR